MDKAESMQEQMGNANREMEILRKNQKEMLEIKKEKNLWARGYINKSSKTEKQREQRLEKIQNRISKDCGTSTKA